MPPQRSQWSWPINLPVQFFGIFPTGVLDNNSSTPWAGELEHKVFLSSVGIGPYIEAAFFHKATKTLLVTDAVISVPSNPPEVGSERRRAPVAALRRRLPLSHPCAEALVSRSLPVLDPACKQGHTDVCGPPQLIPPQNLLDAAARNFFIDVLAGELASQPVDGVPLKPTELTPAVKKLGWRRMALQILYIVPGDLRDPKK